MTADAGKSVADYRAIAAQYDQATRRINGVRRDAVGALNLEPDETVMDVGCGSGFSFGPILEAIGPSGRLLAFDHSPELLSIAESRIENAGWKNVVLRESTAEAIQFDSPASALLFSYVHDVLQSEAAIDNLLRQASPRARVALCGTKLLPWWGLPVNVYLYVTHRHYITNRNENFHAPWTKLARRLDSLDVQVRWPPGWRYVATGNVR